ncbi:carboxylating nicotinate-nucleotide diphosphorylase [Granulicella cerasi]|uniref:nicotinate-nucleotide diphosphorylase (carboxylating) n=1 Tax=Granulicella cerasi TaxID=741063 RepID=A0ABW1Z5H8_9BACT|nr:carboxylating nicotinate-nucleotide diphosphorylase [Granulicella cerasi]
MKPASALVESLVAAALAEDAPWGDLSAQTFVPADATMTAQLTAREDGVLCGEALFATAMDLTSGAITTIFRVHDGEHFTKGTVLATVEGPARAILQAERVALNFAQRLSGIATQTAKYVAATAGTSTRITDTRKTTPGLRQLERYAVRCGGGHNHRFSLSDAVMLKDNHLAVLTQNGQRPLTEALREAARALPHTTHIEVEVDRIDQIEPVLASGVVNTLMLDNFSLDQLREGSALARKLAPSVLIEASGGITLERIPELAAAGVDIISVGALTHSVRALDLGLDVA